MRKFKCYDCNYTWKLPHGQGGRGVDQICPKCGSKNIHRLNKERGGGLGWRRSQADQDTQREGED